MDALMMFLLLYKTDEISRTKQKKKHVKFKLSFNDVANLMFADVMRITGREVHINNDMTLDLDLFLLSKHNLPNLKKTNQIVDVVAFNRMFCT